MIRVSFYFLISFSLFLSTILCHADLSHADTISSNCSAIGREVAHQQGGNLVHAEFSGAEGKSFCIVVVLIAGMNGEKPRRVEVAVPVK